MNRIWASILHHKGSNRSSGFFRGQANKFLPARNGFNRHLNSFRSNASRQTSRKRAVLWAFVASNVAVFGSWTYARGKPDLALQQTLSRHFLISHEAVTSGRYWTLITNGFSHQSFSHFLFNMITLTSFSSVLLWHPAVSAGQFIGLILGSSIFCSFAFLQRANAVNVGSYSRANGASGITLGVGGVAACLEPRARFALFGVLPAPLWVLVGGFGLFNTMYMERSDHGLAAAGHLGGLLFGIAFYLVEIRRGRIRRF